MKKIISFALLAGIIFLYYFLAWGSLQNFNQMVDPCENLFCDFTLHYHPTAQSIFEVKEPMYGYLYSPFFAILTSPLGHLSLDTASVIWGLIQITLTLLLFFAPLLALNLDTLPKQLIYTAIFFTSLPVLHNFKWGQVSSFVTLTIIASFLAHKSGKPIWAGALLGLGASIKYYPGILILYFLLKRDNRVILSFALTCFILIFLLPTLAVGFDSWINFMSLSFQKLSTFTQTVENPNTQYFPYVTMRLFGIDPARVFVAQVLRFIGFGFALLNIVLLWFIHKRKLDPDGILSVSILFCILPFLIETSWHHYFIFLPFIQVSLLQIEHKNRRKLLIILSVFLSSIFLVNIFPTWLDYTQWGFSLLSSSVVLFIVYWYVLEILYKQRVS
jgi:hypothetical protein